MVKSTIANLITSIKNAEMARKKIIRIAYTKNNEIIVKILLRERFIESIRKHQETIQSFLVLTLRNQNINIENRKVLHFKQISRPSLRIYSSYDKIPRILGGRGVVIISTSQGIMTGQEAKLKKLGGELLLYIWE
uniref:Small ribosomal subunit protein uS8c n=1 Tax=Monotropa uniflora TaxID=50148 RepID=A0A221SR05_MONUN|nr:ribosomal protein S8 [Monotropa uniflora]ASN78973.1 ribosomal protein S8 [Monotropa uniflora]